MESGNRGFASTYAIADPSRLSEVVSPDALEYIAIKQEQQTRLILRDTALYITIGGVLTSASILGASTSATAAGLVRFFSYAAPAFSLAMFLIYFRSDYYLSLARRYIVRDLGPRIVDQVRLAVGGPTEDAKASRGFRWETYHRRPRIIWLVMRLISTLVTLAVFLGPMAISFVFSGGVAGVYSSQPAQVVAGTSSVIIIVGIIRLTFL